MPEDIIVEFAAPQPVEVIFEGQLCIVRTDKNFTLLWEIMFDTLFKAKEYVFKRHTHKKFLKSIIEDKFE